MENQAKPKPGYWAVLPAAVRYDPALPPIAKLLYAELSALANFSGYCYAGNRFLAELYAIDIRSVRRLLAALSDRGYISVAVETDEHNTVIGRKIYCGINPLTGEDVSASGALPGDRNVPTPRDKIVPTPGDRNVPTPGDKIVPHNNININNIPPITPLEGGSEKAKAKQPENWKPDRFEKFWQFYPRKTNKKAAQRAWNKLKASDALIAEIAVKLALLKAAPAWSDKQYIPHASTFLNGARWNDVEDLAAAPPASSGWAQDPEVLG